MNMKSCSVLRKSKERRKGRGEMWGQSETVKERARNPKFTLKEVGALVTNFTGGGASILTRCSFY